MTSGSCKVLQNQPGCKATLYLITVPLRFHSPPSCITASSYKLLAHKTLLWCVICWYQRWIIKHPFTFGGERNRVWALEWGEATEREYSPYLIIAYEASTSIQMRMFSSNVSLEHKMLLPFVFVATISYSLRRLSSSLKIYHFLNC